MDGTRQVAHTALGLARWPRALGALVVAVVTVGALAGPAFGARPSFVEGPEEPAFTVEKLQAIKGAGGGFTTALLVGKAGQTVEYEIIVANTGNTALTFAPLQDANCTNISPAGPTELEPGASEAFTCEHTLTTPGEIWSNEVTVESGLVSEDSNEVFVRTIEEPEFTIEKLEKIHDSEAAFTTAELTGKLEQAVDYEIAVSNIGNRTLTFSPLSDANCTGIAPAGATELAPGTSETFTCQHVLTAVGTWTNQAEIEAAFRQEEQPSIESAVRAHAVVALGEGAIKKLTSNQVLVNVPAEPTVETKPSNTPVVTAPQQQVKAQCTISESLIRLFGASGSKRKAFHVRVPALGIKQITFHLDGRQVKTLTSAQATNGRFVVTIDPSKLGYGAHKVSVKTVMSESACAAIARSAVFVHPRPPHVKPKFTG